MFAISFSNVVKSFSLYSNKSNFEKLPNTPPVCINNTFDPLVYLPFLISSITM